MTAEIVQLCSALVWPHSESGDSVWLSSSCGQDSKGSGRNWRADSSWETDMRGCERKVAIRRNDGTYSKDRTKTNRQKSREGLWPSMKCDCPHHHNAANTLLKEWVLIVSDRWTTDSVSTQRSMQGNSYSWLNWMLNVRSILPLKFSGSGYWELHNNSSSWHFWHLWSIDHAPGTVWGFIFNLHNNPTGGTIVSTSCMRKLQPGT